MLNCIYLNVKLEVCDDLDVDVIRARNSHVIFKEPDVVRVQQCTEFHGQLSQPPSREK